MKWLRIESIHDAVSGQLHLHTLYQCSRFDSTDVRDKSHNQYNMLSVCFKKDMSCITEMDQKVLDIYVIFVFLIGAALYNYAGF